MNPPPNFAFVITHHGNERRTGSLNRYVHSCGYFYPETRLKMLEVFSFVNDFKDDIAALFHQGNVNRELFQRADITLLQYSTPYDDNWTWDVEVHLSSPFNISGILQKSLELFKENNSKDRIILGQGYSDKFKEVWPAKEETND